MKIAALGDIHLSIENTIDYAGILKRAAQGCDVLLLCGDLTQEGKLEEAHELKKILQNIPIPIIAVLGNHDYENGQDREITQILKSPTVHILEGDQVVIDEIGFAGVKGFIGGFAQNMLPKFGEKLLKDVVDAAAQEALLLEKALSLLRTNVKVVLTHYAPIPDTVIGEPAEIYPFLGLTRLEGPINRAHTRIAFHGHAHLGTYEGQTSSGVPVFNVSYPILQKMGMNASIHDIQI